MNNAGNYDEIKEKIKENQQQRLFQSEIILIAVILGLLINIFSSLLYDIFLSNYKNGFSLLLITLFSIIGVFLIFSRLFFNSDSRVHIYHYSYDIISAGLYGAGLEKELRDMLDKFGLSLTEYNDLCEKFERSLVKIMSDEKMPRIGNNVIKSTKNEENVNEIIIDISKDDVDAQLNIRLTPVSYRSIFDAPDEVVGEFSNLYLEMDCYLNDSRQKNSLSFYNDFKIREHNIIDKIRSYYLLILGHHWQLIDEKSLFYHMVTYLELDQ